MDINQEEIKNFKSIISKSPTLFTTSTLTIPLISHSTFSSSSNHVITHNATGSTFSYSPLKNENGKTAGIIKIGNTPWLIPCYRKADGVIGMYDIIGSKFIESRICCDYDEGIPKKLSDETSTFLYQNDDTLKLALYENGKPKNQSEILPSVKDIKISKNTVIVFFADGTKEKATLSREDTFSFEQGISICLTKKMFSMLSDGHGSSVYNKLIKHCVKVYKRNRKAEHDAETKKLIANERRNKQIEKSKAKKEKKIAAEREEQIEIQKEAFLRAMKEFNEG